MQRIISLQTFRTAERSPGSGEFVTKRLCCSFVFSVAFLSVLGGFLLGRYATDRALLLKNVSLQHRQRNEQDHALEIMNNITASVNRMNNLSRHDVGWFDYKMFNGKLSCANFTADYDEALTDSDFALKSGRALNAHLEALARCFEVAANYLENALKNHQTSDD